MTRVKVVGRVVDRPVVGHEDQVDAALATLRSRGDLVVEGQRIQLPDGRIAVDARIVDRTPTPRPRRRVRVRWVAAGGVALGLVGVGYLVYLAWAWILGAVVLAAVVWVRSRRPHRDCEITVIHKRR
jgi:hypothetical protein